MPINPLAARLSGTSNEVSWKLSGVKLGRKSPAVDPLLFELPQHLDLIAARLQNGENLFGIFEKQARSSGKVAEALDRLARRLRLGATLEDALEQFGQELNSELVWEMVNKLKLSLLRGTPLAAQFQVLAAAARAKLRVAQLKAAGRNELAMLVPLVFLILPVTIAFAVFPSLQLLQLGL